MTRLTAESEHDIKTLVFHEALAEDIVDVMRSLGAPGAIVPCVTDHEFEVEAARCDVLIAAHCDLHPVMQNPRLRWIQSLASGVETWLTSPGPPRCPITRMTGVYEPYMAEYVVAHLLCRSQRIQHLREAQAGKAWIEPLGLQATLLRGKQVGVAGLGHVGAAVARACAALGMRVVGLRRAAPTGSTLPDVEHVFSIADKARFFEKLDFLVLAMPLTPASERFLDREALRLLPSHAVVVNISRGGLVDEAALADALGCGEIAGAVLDTFEIEPLPEVSALWTLPNVTITPHMAGAVYASEVAEVCARNLKLFASGHVPEPVVDLAAGY